MKVAFPHLLEELRMYGEHESMKYKVVRVIRKCVESGRIELADKIAYKYNHLLPQSDMVMAAAMSLWHKNV